MDVARIASNPVLSIVFGHVALAQAFYPGGAFHDHAQA
jgi:hypothetical protein